MVAAAATDDKATSNKNSSAAPLLSSLLGGNNNNSFGYDGVVVSNENYDDGVSRNGSSVSSDFEHHGTTQLEAFLNLLKGYFGAGMLSLPWALSQLGVVYGSAAVFLMAFWSSYNCWTVVKLKRFIERTQDYNLNPADAANNNNNETGSVYSGTGASGTGGLEAASVASSKTNLTFPDVGEWAYGAKFQSYVSACVCTQQLAICTVFISFVGENLLAVFDRMKMTGFLDTHIGVMTLCLPCVLSLSFMPSMKKLAPIMALGTILLALCVALLGVIMGKEWDSRPDELPSLHVPQMPLAACAILYSYEGICLILPIESSMQEPKHFKKVFVSVMTFVAVVLAAFATINVYIFGNVTNGSITAFLLEAYQDDPSVTFYLMAANTAVSLSVLLSYPLQLFPAVELIGSSKFAQWLGGLEPVEEEEEDDLSGFEPLAMLPEHEVADLDSLPSEHQYGQESEPEPGEEDEDKSVISKSMQSVTSVIFPKMIMHGDSPQLRAFLVIMTYLVAVAVPNVQALISLVGALAGSSTALLIPPILELAWIQTLEEHRADTKAGATTPTSASSPVNTPPGSPFRDRRATATKKAYVWFGGKYWASKLKSYVLLGFGLIFAAIGTYASLMDIVRIYKSGE